MIIEGRTIKNVAEMLEFCLAAIAQTGVEPSAICLHVAQDMRVAEVTLKDGSTVYCGPVLRHSAEPIQAANFRSAVAF